MYINNRVMFDLSLLGFTANVQLVVTHVISIAICAQFKWPVHLSHPSTMAKAFDHFSSITKMLQQRDAKAKAQAETAKQLVIRESADVLKKERQLAEQEQELAQQKADLQAYAQDLMQYKCLENSLESYPNQA